MPSAYGGILRTGDRRAPIDYFELGGRVLSSKLSFKVKMGRRRRRLVEPVHLSLERAVHDRQLDIVVIRKVDRSVQVGRRPVDFVRHGAAAS
jgi:hypothetical protein